MFWRLVWGTVLFVAEVNAFSYRHSHRMADEVIGTSRALGMIGPAEMRYGSVEECSGHTWNRISIAPRGKGVTDEKLKHLEGLTSIVGLDLSHTSITDAGLSSIRGVQGLRFLQLAGTDVTDAGMQHLVGMSSLQAIDLSGTKVTQNCADTLRLIRGLRLVCAAGTTLTEVPGVRVDVTHTTDSWLRQDWTTLGHGTATKSPSP